MSGPNGPMSGASGIRPGSLQAWVLAARPRTLPVSLAPVLVGTAVAWRSGGFRIDAALAAGFGALLLQIASNFANDVFDFEKGADTEERIGPPRATQTGLLSPRALRVGLVVVLALALGVGVFLTAIAGPAVVAIGLLSIAAAIAYTGGPWPLGYHGLGDPTVFLFFGVIAVMGTAFVQTGSPSLLAFVASLPAGCLATAILVVNNLRDVDSDARVGKRTLAVRWGRVGAQREWAVLVLGAYVLCLAPWLALGATAWTALPWLCAPRAWSLWRAVRGPASGPELNAALAGTAQLAFVHSALFAVGLVP